MTGDGADDRRERPLVCWISWRVSLSQALDRWSHTHISTFTAASLHATILQQLQLLPAEQHTYRQEDPDSWNRRTEVEPPDPFRIFRNVCL